jgi:hypothetical protein
MPKRWWEIIHIRPQVMLSVMLLGIIAIIAMYQDMTEIAGVAGAGIIALAKDVITSDGT